jgi:alkylation response protein AidB-like acyl-CoA dehydrogenase
VTTETAQMLRSLADDVLGSLEGELKHGTACLDNTVCLGKPWDTIRELEWPVVGIPESLGGAGGDLEDVLALAESVGRNAVNVPLLAAHSAYAAAAAGGRADLLGKRLVVETQPRWSSLRVEELGRQLRISGTARRTPWARHADALLVRVPEAAVLEEAVLEEAGPRWIACDPRDPSVTITPGLNLAGEARDDVLFDNLVVGAENRWECADGSLATRGTLLGCAALVGAIDATVALTSRYVSERKQFGRPLAALQSVAQAVALMRCQLSAARAAAEGARQSPTTMNCLAAHVDIACCASRVARTAHDLHGAMGVAGEYGLHPFTKRLWAWPEEGIRQTDARVELGRHAAERGAANLWADVTA